MTKPIKIMIIIFVLLGGLAIAFFLRFTKSVGEVDVPLTQNDYVINFEELNEKVYVKAKAWGLAGNNEEIILSVSPISDEHKAYSKDECFIFYTSEVYYKKKDTNTLLIYVDYKSKIPPNLSTKIKIIQIQMKDNAEIQDYRMNYEKYGLSKISIYKDKDK